MGWMSFMDMIALSHVAKLVPDNGIIVEVGSMFGKSALAWATQSKASKIYCVDTFNEEYNVEHGLSDSICLEKRYPLSGVEYNILKIFTENTKHEPRIIPIRKFSPHNVIIPEDKIDLFFLDASHTNPNDWENIEFYLPMIKNGGIISGHDHDIEQFPDVVDNVSRLEKITGNRAEFYQGSSVWSIVI